MKSWEVLCISLLLCACAAAPVAPPPESLFNDGAFAAPSQRIRAEDVFALSDEMRSFLSVDIASQLHRSGNRRGLVDAIRKEAQLKLEYDSKMTRNAAEAFAARSGNCLSLVIMTAALAKQLGLEVHYRSAPGEELVGLDRNTQYFIGHVNLSLAEGVTSSRFGRTTSDEMVVDFLPPQDLRGMITRPITEATVVAMYMNNRAVESLAEGNQDDAYWWAKAALGQDPRFVSAYNTLGVVYLRRGDLARSERLFTNALERDPLNTHVMANLAGVYSSQGRSAEARAITARLRLLEPDAAFGYFDRGIEAMREGDYRAAEALIAKEVARAPQYPELHFWLAITEVRLGKLEDARKQLLLAMEYSTTREDRAVYATKLERLRAGDPR